MKNNELYDEDDILDFDKQSQLIKDEIDSNNRKFVSEIFDNGENYLSEIKIKLTRKQLKKVKVVNWILTHSDIYFEHELNGYTYEDVLNIKKDIERTRQNKIKRILSFILDSH